MVITWEWLPMMGCFYGIVDGEAVCTLTRSHVWNVLHPVLGNQPVASGCAGSEGEARDIILSILEIRVAYRS